MDGTAFIFGGRCTFDLRPVYILKTKKMVMRKVKFRAIKNVA
jgi:hypothetical protein